MKKELKLNEGDSVNITVNKTTKNDNGVDELGIAESLSNLYKSFKAMGFTEDQSFELIKTVLGFSFSK